jgi:PII-like signaling protein
MRAIEGEQVLLRLILSESRTHDGRPLFATLVEVLRAEGLAGATVLKGIAGFGHDTSPTRPRRGSEERCRWRHPER